MPVGIAVALIGRPGVAAHCARSLARLGDGVDEAAAAQQRIVEAWSAKALGGTVLDRPAGGDDAAHADLDQFFGDTGGEARSIRQRDIVGPVLSQQLRCVARGEMAAIDEDQLGHHAHAADFARTEECAVGKHDAARVAVLLRRVARLSWRRADLLRRRAVPGDVDDAPVAPEQRVDDGSRVGTDLLRRRPG